MERADTLFATPRTSGNRYPGNIGAITFRQQVLGLLAVAAVLISVLTGCKTEQRTSSTADTTDTSAIGMERPPSPPDEALAPRLQLLYRQCDEGDDESCTELATLAPEDSEEYRFAVSCGEREETPRCAPPEE